MQTQHKKKVLFLITKSNWGGAQRYVYDLATNLDQRLFEPVVAMGGAGELHVMLQNAGIRTITIHSLIRDVSSKHEWAFFKELTAIIKTEKPDVFHINSSKAGAVGALVGRLYKIPRIIFTAHGWAFNEQRPLWQRLLIKAIHWMTVVLSHRTIAVSRAIITQMNWPGAERRMKLIHPGRTIGPMYEYHEAREKICDFFPQLRPFQHHAWIGCIAELHPIKRHDLLIESMKTLVSTRPDVKLICIGNGEMRTALELQIKKAGLQESIFFVGALTDAARFIPAFEILTLVSDSESYGYVLHEAGLGKVAVVATKVGGIPDIITPNVSGVLVPPNSASDITAALTTLLDNPHTRQQYGNVLFEHMTLRTVAKMTKETATLYTLAR